MTEVTKHEPGMFCLMPPMDIENVGRFAMLTDPEGAGFAAIKLNAPAG